MSQLRVTWVRSSIGCNARQKATVRALGLRRLHHTVFHEESPAVLGMLHAVRHLVEVQPASDGDLQPAKKAKAVVKVITPAPAEGVARQERAPKHKPAVKEAAAAAAKPVARAAAPAAAAEQPEAAKPATG